MTDTPTFADRLASQGCMLYGGDYNPEQWPEEIWHEDMRLLREAGVNEVTLNVFSWAQLQPSEDEYDFSRLDRIIETVTDAGLSIVMATSTGALPAWMALRHPDVNRVDEKGRKMRHRERHNACINSPTFRRYSVALAGKLAERYGHLDNLVAWHIGNEYGGMCWCDTCAERFRDWLKARYGSIEAVNEAWNAAFWSHTYHSFDEIFPPNELGDMTSWGGKAILGGYSLDYQRFYGECVLDSYNEEKAAIRRFDPVNPVTTNMMGTYPTYDYFRWRDSVDVVSWDSYPRPDAPAADVAMNHELMRGVGGGRPFMLMEQTPNQQNWFPYCKVKRPGEVAALSWQAVAHGADTVQFFQMRQSLGGCERFHGAVIAHDGTEDSRVFRETAALGDALERVMPTVMGSGVQARVAIMFDWESYWSLEGCVGPTAGFSYPEEVHRFYRAFHRRNIAVDIIPSTTPAATLARYAIVVAPALIMVKPGVADTVETYVDGGGRFITGYMAGIHDEHDLVIPGGYPGPFRALVGVWAEEIDAIAPGEHIPVVFGARPEGDGDGGPVDAGSSGSADAGADDSTGSDAAGEIVASIMHLEGARTLATYGGDDFYAGTPAVTVNDHGLGRAYYVGTPLDEPGMDAFAAGVLADAGLAGTVTPDGVEIAERRTRDGRTVTFVLNMTPQRQTVSLPHLAGLTDLLAVGGAVLGDVVAMEPYQVIVTVE